MTTQRIRRFRLAAIATGMLASGLAVAETRIDPALAQRLLEAVPTDQLQVVITYGQSGPVTSAQRRVLQGLGITRGITLRELPIAGALATPSEIRALVSRGDALSVHLNRNLRYSNADARRMSGVDRVQANPGDFGLPSGLTGEGVAVMVNDSGIDATHADLLFGEHVVENVQALTNLGSVLGLGQATYLEGQLNTDISSGHGTHCAGSVGGTGAQSSGGQRGVAPNASIVGYGSGAVISILDAVGGIDYAIANQHAFGDTIKVISNSWGSTGDFDPTDPVNIATYEAAKRGIVSVFAAGNDGPAADTHNPYAQAPWVVSVGAANKDGTLADFSSRGQAGEGGTFTMPDGVQWTWENEPTVVATGVDIVSTRALTGLLPLLATGQDVSLGALAPYYTHMSGTSMATPHVAGIIALLFEANPDLTPLEVRAVLHDTADAIGTHAEWEVGGGHVDAYEAVGVAVGL